MAAEKNFENKVKKFLKENGCWILKYWGGAAFTRSGIPDLLVCCKADLKVFETMRKQNPRRYKVAGLGDWGIVDGLVYENWKEEAFTLEQIRQQYHIESAFGLDFGYTNDPSALFAGFIDVQNKKIFVWDEMYSTGLSNEKIYQNITDMGYAKEKITADSAEPKSIDQLTHNGKTWISTVDNNVWEPGVYGWEVKE